jgi:hypothetical protein
MNRLLSKKVLWMTVPAVSLLVLLFGLEESRTFLAALFLRILFFAKKYVVEILTAFFLVKGKFIFSLFMKKIAMLSATGLGKRYLIEKVINHNLKIHFLDHISDDIKRLALYVKENFKDFPIVKQIVASMAFLGSLGFVGKFMGGMLAMKVFVAKFWSFILAVVLKFTTGIVYFFTDYLWGSWIAPIVEIVLFSWLLEWMEKIPFFKQYLVKIYAFFIGVFAWFETYVEKVFHIPVKRFFKLLAQKIKKFIYAFIGYERVSSWRRLQEIRELNPNSHATLLKKRNLRVEKKRKTYISVRERVKAKRINKIGFS